MSHVIIIVVEDKNTIVTELQERLKNWGYIVPAVVSSGALAIEKAAEMKPDLVLMDIVLNSTADGIEASEQIRTNLDIPVVYVTDEQTVQQAKLAEPYACILKPFDNQELRIIIEMAINRHQMEKRIKQNEQCLDTILKNIGEGIIATDSTGRVILMNPIAEALTGQTLEKTLNRELTEVFHIINETTQTFPVESPFMKILKDGLPVGSSDRVLLISCNGAETPIEYYATPIRDDSGNITGLVLIFHKVIDRRLAEDELKKANRKILEQQKAVIEEERLKVLLQMAGATFYELNQPLTSLLGNVDLMKMNKDDPGKLVQYIARVKEAGEQIFNIMKKIQTIRNDKIKPYFGELSDINHDKKIKILAVEDSDLDFEIIRAILKKQSQVSLSWEKNIENAVQLLEKEQFDLIFLDYMLPDGDGLNFLRILDEKGLETPVVMITGRGDEMLASQAIHAGAYDYLTKGKVSYGVLSRVISNTLEKAFLKREADRAVKIMTDMSVRDELTGLYNYSYFKDVLEREVSRARRYQTELSLCIMELDHFKQINDSLGYSVGNIILSEIGRMLKQSFRMSDLVCRYKDKKFAVILPNVEPDKVCLACERFRSMVAEYKFRYRESQFQVTLSIKFAHLGNFEIKSADEFVKLAELGNLKLET